MHKPITIEWLRDFIVYAHAAGAARGYGRFHLRACSKFANARRLASHAAFTAASER
jgi:hypothetical protein